MRRFKSTVFRSIMKFFKRKKRLSETRLFERKNDLTAWRHGVERIPKNEREKTAVSVYVLPPFRFYEFLKPQPRFKALPLSFLLRL